MNTETKTKFKVGDKVRVKDNLVNEGVYNGCRFDSTMKNFCGKIAKITSANKYECGDRYEIEGCLWNWSNDMFIAQIVSINDLQFGDILTLRNGERYVYADKYIYGESKRYYCDTDTVNINFRENLTRDSSLVEYDIIKIERYGQIVYEREDVKEMTVEEISKALGYEVKVVK